MRLIAKGIALVLVLLTTGCIVESDNTLADPDPKQDDKRLAGTWVIAERTGAVMFSAVPDEKSTGRYHVVYVEVKPGLDKPVQHTRYTVWRSVIAGKAFLNIVPVDAPAKTMIAAYDIDGQGRLMLRLMSTKFVATAVDAGKLKGTVKRGQYGEDVRITASRAELAAFVAAADRNALFSAKTGLLHKLPETRS